MSLNCYDILLMYNIANECHHNAFDLTGVIKEREKREEVREMVYGG